MVHRTQAARNTRLLPTLALLGFAAWGCLVGTTAMAQRMHGHGGPAWRGDIAHFHEHDWDLWRGGHWAHARHGGRMGWWWIVGPNWYFYPSPIYPYPSPWEPPPAVLVNPPMGMAPPAPPTQYWYYCESAQGYYPYVPTCPGGWVRRPATPGEAMPESPR